MRRSRFTWSEDDITIEEPDGSVFEVMRSVLETPLDDDPDDEDEDESLGMESDS